MISITPSQKRVRDLYIKYFESNWVYPTYEEAGIGLWMSWAWVFKHIKALENLWILKKTANGQIVRVGGTHQVELLWEISCGYWNDISNIEISFDHYEDKVEVPESILPWTIPWYALKAKGESMEGIWIFEWDILIIKYQTYANEGDIVVAILKNNFEEKAILKEFRTTMKWIINLKPYNRKFSPIVVTSENPIEIRWKLVGIISNFNT